MIRVNIAQMKGGFSEYARKVKGGETLLLCDRNVPFAEVKPLPVPGKRHKRVFGQYRGKIWMSETFGEWDSAMEDAFYGKKKSFERT